MPLPQNVQVVKSPNIVDAKQGVITYSITYTAHVDITIAEDAIGDGKFVNQSIDYGVRQLMHNIRNTIEESRTSNNDSH